MSGNNARPVIIRRKRVVAGEGHHGGAWKVAYADFVTAMMAFFLLMWLLGATTEEDRKGIADYFNVSIPLNPVSGGGDGTLNGDTVFESDVLARSGRGAAVDQSEEANRARGVQADAGESPGADPDSVSAALQSIEDILSGSGGESMVSDELLHHVVTRQTDEGLVIELHDLPGAALFSGEDPTELYRQLIAELSPVMAIVANRVAVGGHVAARPIVAVAESPWSTSTGRAEATRELLEGAGTDSGRIHRVTGHGDRDPVTVNGMAPRNSRVEIVLLRNEY